MKRLCLFAVVCMALSSCSKDEMQPLPVEDSKVETAVEEPAVPGQSVVKLSDELMELIGDDLNSGRLATRSMGLNDALSELGISSIRRLFPHAGEFEPRTRKAGLHKWFIVEYDTSTPATRAVSELQAIDGIELAEARRPIKPCGFNDPYLEKQWQYSNTEYPGIDVNIEPVWNHRTTGRPDVVVAVVDGGIDLSHPDLASNCHSEHYNFVDDNTKIESYDHGVHVAGVIGAVNNNGIGVSGLAGGDAAKGIQGVKMMSCQIFKYTKNYKGETITVGGSTSAAIKWAADHGAVIAQNSWGYSFDTNGDGKLTGSELSTALNSKVSAADKEAIDYFIRYAGCDNDGNQLSDSPMKGGVVIFAAGNDGIENGVPANYDPVVAVGALDKGGDRAYYSNYGGFVDIAAPGTGICSTLPEGKYGNMSGTSMACPHVSGVAALVVSYFGGPGFTNEMLTQKLLGGSNTKIISPSYQIGGLVDALGAIDYGSELAPDPIDDLSAEAVSNTIKARWTVPENSSGEPAYGFRLFCGKDKELVDKAELTADSTSVLHVSSIVPELGVGETVSYELKNLEFSTDYYIKVIAYSYFGYSVPVTSSLKVTTRQNNPPVITTDYTPVSLKAFQTLSIPLSISDPDGHACEVFYESGSRADVFVSLSSDEGSISITAVNAEAGTYKPVITVTDAYGASSSLELTYTILENNAPVAVKEAENLLLASAGSEFSMNMKEYFSDADGEPLSYLITIADKSIASATVEDDVFKGTVLGYGRTSLTIEALDARKASASVSFNIVARDPEVECQMYPNPVKDVLNIATGKDMETARIRIVSATGASVFEGTKEISAFEPGQVDMSGCAPGKYSVTVEFGSKQSRQTIVKR